MEVKFIDIDWGGRQEGQLRYPAFLNNKASWPESDPTELLITQEHDRSMLKDSLSRSKVMRGGVQGRAQGPRAAAVKARRVDAACRLTPRPASRCHTGWGRGMMATIPR